MEIGFSLSDIEISDLHYLRRLLDPSTARVHLCTSHLYGYFGFQRSSDVVLHSEQTTEQRTQQISFTECLNYPDYCSFVLQKKGPNTFLVGSEWLLQSQEVRLHRSLGDPHSKHWPEEHQSEYLRMHTPWFLQPLLCSPHWLFHPCSDER